MPTMEYEGVRIAVDDEGYLVNFDDWSEKVACALADREGVSQGCPLTKERMDILKFMRDYYKQHGSFPVLRAVCKNIHQPKECTYEQFPDPITAWKIAGLPQPTTEVFAYLRHHQ
ncbi:MAG: TusE/DsrC/DsvC family sulfur relay protein [Pseudomonadota bacterium]